MSDPTNELIDDRHRDGNKLDQVLEALNHPARCQILASLIDNDPRTNGALNPTTLTPDDRRTEEYALKLHHTHLPWLDGAGYVHWDRDADTITRGPKFEDVEQPLSLLRTHQGELPGEWPQLFDEHPVG